MKTTNAQIINRKSGMTLLELTVVILVLLSLIAILFVGARAWKQGSDRSANIMNVRNCQQAMRGHQNMRELEPGATFDEPILVTYMKYPRNIGNFVTYSDIGEIMPPSATPAVDANHLWLVPSVAIDDATYGFNDVAETTGW